MNIHYPPISVVIIGLNVERYIKDCITSLLEADYSHELIEIIYVDGGSNDKSVLQAQSFKGVKIIELKDIHPTPGKGRNAGYKAAHHELIQFLDADTAIEADWFKIAVPYIRDNIAAIIGRVIEKYPHKNRYHLIGNIEWNLSAARDGYRFSNGSCKTFGGNVLVRKEALEMVNGYDAGLIAGEDPDISYRIRQEGWVIYQINTKMVHHDLNINSFKQYLKRAFRSGHAYAQIGFRYITYKEKYYARQLIRIIIGAVLPLIIFFLSIIFNIKAAGAIFALLVLLRPLIKMIIKRKKYDLNLSHAFLYGLHVSLIIYPQIFGVIRYIISRIFGIPLQNRGYKTSIFSTPDH